MEPVRKYIRIGLLTDGKPLVEPAVRHGIHGHVIKNLRIGNGFHWQQGYTAFFPGELEYLESPQEAIHVVNIVPVEDYILSVISSEMNPEAPVEFLKAHAVISRSWAVRKMLHDPNEQKSFPTDSRHKLVWEGTESHQGFDVCSDDHCQRYQGLSETIPENARVAIESTIGEVLQDAEGAIADTRFSKCCGGKTEIFSTCWEDGDYSYLDSKTDPWCNLDSMSTRTRNSFLTKVLKSYDVSTDDFFNWEKEVDKNWLRKRILNRKGVELGELQAIEPVTVGPSGRAVSVRIKGTEGDIIIGKELAIRRLLSPDCLYSSWFEVHDRGDHFLLKGHGWGHGVGLCQIGAARMAIEGKEYQDILEFYYPGTRIGHL